jgi:hypothetical protein
MTETVNEGLLAKITALLAKAERTDNEHEQNAYFEKAQALIIKYSVDQSQLKPAEREQVINKIIPLTPKRADHTLLNVVCINNHVKFIVASGVGKNRRGWLVGFPSDIAFCEALYANLLLHRENELSRAVKPGWEHGKSFNHSFRLAYGARVGKRLEAFHAHNVQSAGTGTELVLRNKDAAVNDFLSEAHKKITKSAPVRFTSAVGAVQGRNAAERADVSGGHNNIGTRRTALN